MKEITVRISEKVFEGLQTEVALRDFAEGCVSPPSILERCMIEIIRKIKKNDNEINIGLKNDNE